MDLVRQKELFQILEQKLNGMGMQTAAAAGAGAPQVGDTMRVLVPITDEGDAVLLELMAASIDEVTEDGQGRTQIPKSFRDYAKLTKDVVTVGMGNYVEIWSLEKFEEQMNGMTIRQANAIAYKKNTEQ